VSHLKIRRTIHETLGKTVENNEIPQSKIYLTNALAPPMSKLEEADQLNLFVINDFSGAVTDEARQADKWKLRRPVKVIIGNPPYLATSSNPYDISEYKLETDGKTKLNEKNPKWLGDDYVKFFRFAEQIIQSNDKGILAFISNNGFLSNPTFRGMRASLMRTFDKIFIVDLHGNAKKKETTPDGSKDENVFDIMQGVSIFIGVKKSNKSSWADVSQADLWGTRESKLRVLEKEEINYSLLRLDNTMGYFIPFGSDESDVYNKGISVHELFNASVVGIVTARDSLCIQFTQNKIESVLRDFQSLDPEELRHQYNLGKDTRDWTIDGAKNDVETRDGNISKIAYRPFDYRYTYFTGHSKGFHCMPRGSIMKHLALDSQSPIGKNIGLIFARNAPVSGDFAMIHIVDGIFDHSILSTQTSTIASVAPLFIYNEADNTWKHNINIDIFNKLTEHMTFSPSPIDVFDYAYGILHDPVYRSRFNEYLKRGFPRIPIVNTPNDISSQEYFFVSECMFKSYIAAGQKLRKLHLMQTKVPKSLELLPNTPDDLEIDKVKYSDGILYINAKKSIHGISDDVWKYKIGGFQVLDKWFKSYKGELLTFDRYSHIEDVVGLLAETIKIQNELRDLHI